MYYVVPIWYDIVLVLGLGAILIGVVMRELLDEINLRKEEDPE